jgi:Ca2+-dependent lipid-binding protein
MNQYISKNALIAEIKKLEDSARIYPSSFDCGRVSAYKELINFLNTFETIEVKSTELLKVKGYLVRDKDDYTAIYAEKPHRGKTEWVNDSCLMTINDTRLVPNIEFEDEPIEVEITLKRLNAGE